MGVVHLRVERDSGTPKSRLSNERKSPKSLAQAERATSADFHRQSKNITFLVPVASDGTDQLYRLKYVHAAIARSTTTVIQSEESLNPVFFAMKSNPPISALGKKISQRDG
jgi:hypothetical protein